MPNLATSSPHRNTRSPSRETIFFVPIEFTVDFQRSNLTPMARLVLTSAWRVAGPLTEAFDAAVVRRETGLDRLTFNAAVLELRRAGLLRTPTEHRAAAGERARSLEILP